MEQGSGSRAWSRNCSTPPAGAGQRRAAPRAGRPAGLLEAARHSIGARGEVVRLALDAELPRSAPTRPSSSGPSPTCSKMPSVMAAATRSWSARAWSGPASSSASSTTAPASPRGSASGSSSLLPTGRAAPATAPGSAWRSPRVSSRPTAARSRSSRCRARAAASWSLRSPAGGRGEQRWAYPRLRRRAPDRAGAEGHPARCRL